MKDQQANGTREKEEKKQSPYQAGIPHKIIDSGLWARMKPSERSVYGVLCKYRNFKNELCFPSVDLICEKSGYGKNAVCKATSQLEHYGLIKKIRTPKNFSFKMIYKIFKNPKIDLHIIPSKSEKGKSYFRRENGKFGSTRQYVKSDVIPSKSENPVTEDTEADVVPEDTEADVVPENTEYNKNEIKLNKYRPINQKKFEDVDFQLTDLLIEKILKNDPKARVPNKDTKHYFIWINNIRLCRERDKRSTEEIKIGIIFSQTSSFWKSNILSTEKLRIKLPTLLHQARADEKVNAQTYVGNQNRQPYNDQDERVIELRKEYKKEMSKFMKERSYKSEDDIPFNDMPELESEYIKRKLREIKREGKNLL